MARPFHAQALDALIGLGRVVGSAIGAASSVIATVRGDGPSGDENDIEGEADEVEELGDCDSWGDPNILSRPLDPNDDGALEALFIRRGDTRELIGFRDRRYQVSLEQGEIIVRNLHADANKRAFIKLTKDGEVFIDAVKVYVGTSSATEKIALGTALKNFLTDLKTWMDAHTHTAVTTATIGTGGVGTVTVNAPASSSPTIPTIESRHVVEGA